MAAETVTVVQLCGVCRTQTGTFQVKKDNLMMTSRDRIWCPQCEASTPEVRDIAGRLESIRKEVESLPEAGSS